MQSKGKIAGMVTLYNSPTSVLLNIESYLSQVLVVYVIDNSDKLNLELLEKLAIYPTIRYIPGEGNRGVAFALNVAASLAISEGFGYLLTMDDDSLAPEGMVVALMNVYESLPDLKIGIVSPNHGRKKSTNALLELNYTMTSGNLLNLEAYKSVGPFQNNLFIDHVDHEYGLRLKKGGFKVLEKSSIKLIHRLGVVKTHFFRKVKSISHSPIRSYYISRNAIVVTRQYFNVFPLFIITSLKIVLKLIIKNVFLEDEKLFRLKMTIKGIKDGFLGNLGKLK